MKLPIKNTFDALKVILTNALFKRFTPSGQVKKTVYLFSIDDSKTSKDLPLPST